MSTMGAVVVLEVLAAIPIVLLLVWAGRSSELRKRRRAAQLEELRRSAQR